jgi:hypothetical protein
MVPLYILNMFYVEGSWNPSSVDERYRTVSLLGVLVVFKLAIQGEDVDQTLACQLSVDPCRPAVQLVVNSVIGFARELWSWRILRHLSTP